MAAQGDALQPCGTHAAYRRGCRCRPCKDANARRSLAYRRRRGVGPRDPKAVTRAATSARSQLRLSRIEDYTFIGGDRLSASQAAKRLGVTPRTVVRYRAALREAS